MYPTFLSSGIAIHDVEALWGLQCSGCRGDRVCVYGHCVETWCTTPAQVSHSCTCLNHLLMVAAGVCGGCCDCTETA